MKPEIGSRPLHDAGWILVGVLLGSSISFVVSGGSIHLDTAGTATTASLALSVLMLSTLRDHTKPLPAMLNARP